MVGGITKTGGERVVRDARIGFKPVQEFTVDEYIEQIVFRGKPYRTGGAFKNGFDGDVRPVETGIGRIAPVDSSGIPDIGVGCREKGLIGCCRPAEGNKSEKKQERKKVNWHGCILITRCIERSGAGYQSITFPLEEEQEL